MATETWPGAVIREKKDEVSQEEFEELAKFDAQLKYYFERQKTVFGAQTTGRLKDNFTALRKKGMDFPLAFGIALACQTNIEILSAARSMYGSDKIKEMSEDKIREMSDWIEEKHQDNLKIIAGYLAENFPLAPSSYEKVVAALGKKPKSDKERYFAMLRRNFRRGLGAIESARKAG